jgi:hypothetical protein
VLFRSLRAPPAQRSSSTLTVPPLTAASAARWYRALWWLSLAWLATLVFVGVSDGRLIDGFFDSDHLYIPALVEDLTRWSTGSA